MARSLLNSARHRGAADRRRCWSAPLAGYGLARIPYRHANAVFYAILATLLIPAAVTFVPSFVLVSSLGWVVDLRGLIVPGLFSGFTTFLFRQYFLGFPKELEEAARIDGLGYWGTFWRIVVPNSTGLLRGDRRRSPSSARWNAFLWPLVIGQDQESWTVQVALSTFLTAQTVNVHQLFMAAAVVHPAAGAGVPLPPALDLSRASRSTGIKG